MIDNEKTHIGWDDRHSASGDYLFRIQLADGDEVAIQADHFAIGSNGALVVYIGHRAYIEDAVQNVRSAHAFAPGTWKWINMVNWLTGEFAGCHRWGDDDE